MYWTCTLITQINKLVFLCQPPDLLPRDLLLLFFWIQSFYLYNNYTTLPSMRPRSSLPFLCAVSFHYRGTSDRLLFHNSLILSNIHSPISTYVILLLTSLSTPSCIIFTTLAASSICDNVCALSQCPATEIDILPVPQYLSITPVLTLA